MKATELKKGDKVEVNFGAMHGKADATVTGKVNVSKFGDSVEILYDADSVDAVAGKTDTLTNDSTERGIGWKLLKRANPATVKEVAQAVAFDFNTNSSGNFSADALEAMLTLALKFSKNDGDLTIGKLEAAFSGAATALTQVFERMALPKTTGEKVAQHRCFQQVAKLANAA